ncbi:MAG: hypothetical protein K1X88_00360 [Nannocystaceae bacterium]|nr:hypothetical protein [Nannocystaceae bacterium]
MSKPRTVVAWVLAGACPTIACFPTPKSTEAIAYGSSTTGIELGGSDDSPYVGSSDGSTAGVAPPADLGDASSASGSSGGDGTTTAGTSGDGGWDTGGDPPPGFPGVEPFGDDVRELDLVGRWSLPWDPTGVASVTLDIADDGAFSWIERDPACGTTATAAGSMWVSGSQLVLHFDAWDKPTPWDTESAIGVDIAPPYRMRVGYVPMGGFLGLAAPEGMVAFAPWQGRAYVRLDATVGATGNWAAETELWAIPPDEASPALIVRDRYDATLSGTAPAVQVRGRTWWWPDAGAAEPDDAHSGPWSDDTPGNTAGAATILGAPYAYDAAGLFSFAADRSFKLGVTGPCG